MTAAKRESATAEPYFDPPTIMPRIAEMVRALAALTSEVCDDTAGLADHDWLLDQLMLAQSALARCIAGREAVAREGELALARLKGERETRGTYHAIMTLAATLATYPGDPCWNGSLLPRASIRPPEPSIIEARAVARAAKLAQERRIPEHDAWSSTTADDEGTGNAS